MAQQPSVEGSRYSQDTAQPLQQQQQTAGGLSREPSYVRRDEEIGGISDGAGLGGGESSSAANHGGNVGGFNESNRLSDMHPQLHNIRGTSHIPGEDQMNREAPGRDYAHVVPHEQYVQEVGSQQHPHGLDYGQSAQTGQNVTQTQTIGEPVGQNGYAGVGAVGYPQGQQYGQEKPDLSGLQPSRSYSTYGQQGGQPLTNGANGYPEQQQNNLDNTLTTGDNAGVNRHHSFAPTARTEQTNAGMAGIGAPVAAQMQPNATAVGTGFENQTLQPLNTNTTTAAPSVTSPVSPISGGGLGAALATSGHSLTSKDKKALKAEIKNEQKFEKQLAVETKHENESIGTQLKLHKLSIKNAEKSAKHEAAYRKTYDKAIQREVKAKKYLIKIQNEYNKVAADLESATKEMEIRRNQHIADVQARDADQQKLEDLRQQKGRNDMQREARHGDSVVKQNQAKRALSMSKRKSII